MSVDLADLVSELQSEVPAVDGVPTNDQYEQAVKDATAEFSRACGRRRTSTLNIVKGTAAYDLPADFLKLIKLTSLTARDGIINSASGLIPVSACWEESFDVVGQTITFYPTPAYTLARQFTYKAAWVLNDADAYELMGEEEKQIVLLKAKAIATDKLYRAQSAGGAQKYSFGAVSVDKSTGTDTLRASASQYESQFASACDRYNGAMLQ